MQRCGTCQRKEATLPSLNFVFPALAGGLAHTVATSAETPRLRSPRSHHKCGLLSVRQGHAEWPRSAFSF